ncbi:MAG: hypothetical protein LJF30_08175 [Acidobacteria bacterium]|jgi:hypothetical protein|nr:hypothetical protein [Acidobacteriota bacterium]
MTRPTSVALAPSSRNPLPARLLPHLVTLLLVCGSVAGAPLAHAQDDAVDEGAQALVPESEEQPTTYALDGRSRFEMRLGASDVWVNETHRVETVDVTGGAASLVFLHWIDERFVIGVHGGSFARYGYSPQGTFGVNLGWAFGGP